MSQPRQVIAGATYLITRRCTQRQFLLTPCESVFQAFLYCMGAAAARTGVIVHAITVMSNHYHAVVTDPLGRIPEFYGWLHEFIGRSLNSKYGRWENFWSTQPTSCVRLVTEIDLMSKLVYTITNPVSAGLVETSSQWPGICLFEPQTLAIERPNWFFRPNGPTPDVAELHIVAPELAGRTAAEGVAEVARAVTLREQQLCTSFRRDGRRFLGAKAILAQRVTDSPSSFEPRRRLSPTIACRNKWLRIEALQRCQQFIAQHAQALARWMRGDRDVVFPAGTYQMARVHGVVVAEP